MARSRAFTPDSGSTVLEPTIKLYPSRLIGRKKLERSGELPYQIYRIYDEVHVALCNNLDVLAGIGIRAMAYPVDSGNHEGMGLCWGESLTKAPAAPSGGVERTEAVLAPAQGQWRNEHQLGEAESTG